MTDQPIPTDLGQIERTMEDREPPQRAVFIPRQIYEYRGRLLLATTALVVSREQRT